MRREHAAGAMQSKADLLDTTAGFADKPLRQPVESDPRLLLDVVASELRGESGEEYSGRSNAKRSLEVSPQRNIDRPMRHRDGGGTGRGSGMASPAPKRDQGNDDRERRQETERSGDPLLSFRGGTR
jgi:hypothetical protein